MLSLFHGNLKPIATTGRLLTTVKGKGFREILA
jgi:hypothetical protein